MNLFKKIALIGKIERSIKRLKELAKDNGQLGIDMQKALENLKADIDIFIGLLPSLRNVLNDIKKLIDDSMA